MRIFSIMQIPFFLVIIYTTSTTMYFATTTQITDINFYRYVLVLRKYLLTVQITRYQKILGNYFFKVFKKCIFLTGSKGK